MRLIVFVPCCCLWWAVGLSQAQLQQQQRQWSHRGPNYSRQQEAAYDRLHSVYDPLEVVDFELMAEPQMATAASGDSASAAYKHTTANNNKNGWNFGGRHKYELLAATPMAAARSRSNRLPLLSRGVRDLDEEEEGDNDYLMDEDYEPTCQELRRMWRIARRIHNRAIQTNKIPQETGHPFADFESDRYRAERRLKNQKGRNRSHKQQQQVLGGHSNQKSAVRADQKGKAPARGAAKGAKEVPSQDLNYGSVRYTSLTDQVKRPRDPVRQIYDKLKGGDATSDDSSKDGGAWATGIRHFEKSPPKPSSFDNLHSELRKSKGMSALAPKDSSDNTWGEMRFFQEKPKTTSPLEMLRDRMQKEDVWQRSRLNYRDEDSGSIRTAEEQQDQDIWLQQGKKNTKNREKNKKKIAAQLERDLLKRLRGEEEGGQEHQHQPHQHHQQQQHEDMKSRKKFRNAEFYKNLLLKG